VAEVDDVVEIDAESGMVEEVDVVLAVTVGKTDPVVLLAVWLEGSFVCTDKKATEDVMVFLPSDR
jgi:hypothetical protein